MLSKNMFTFLFCLYIQSYIFGQINYTAHDNIPVYDGGFHFGVNPGAHAGWTDDQLGDISRDIGINTFRPTLPESFLDYWGYDIRLDVFQHYGEIGLEDNTVFIGYPALEHREDTMHCNGAFSETFANLYEPIWDDGTDGTPFNEDNYYAAYCYKMAQTYKDNVTFWEVWNEPDFSFTIKAVEPPGTDGNWWEFNPDPCDHAFRAPITHYIRMLRISYEVIKSVDPTSYICTGGLGYPSYLDAILRNTDNPNNGLVTEEFSKTGGAYFDVVSFHSYPHIDNSLRYWNNDIFDFSYTRHSDAAVDGFVRLKKEFAEVLERYEYNNVVHPEKMYMVTETNLPRRRRDESAGSDEIQRNYLVKAVVACYQEDILQLHPYSLAELEESYKAQDPFQVMGFYEKLTTDPNEKQQTTPSGIAWKAAAEFLKNKKYDAGTTASLNLPENIRGAAFLDENGQQSYVLWAVTELDNFERTKAFYTFPADFNYDFLAIQHWNFTETERQSIVANKDVLLTGEPVFIQKAITFPDDYLQVSNVQGFPNPFNNTLDIEINLTAFGAISLELMDARGVVTHTFIDNEFYAAGQHQFNFSAEKLPVGVYFLKLATENRLKVHRLLKF